MCNSIQLFCSDDNHEPRTCNACIAADRPTIPPERETLTRREVEERRFEATGRKLRTFLTDPAEANLDEVCELTAADVWREFQDEFMTEERAIELYDFVLEMMLERTEVLLGKVVAPYRAVVDAARPVSNEQHWNDHTYLRIRELRAALDRLDGRIK